MHEYHIRQLVDEFPPLDSGKQSTVLADDQRVKIILFRFAAGTGLAEHVAPCSALIQIIHGEARLTVGHESFLASPGTWVQMVAQTPHSVQAATPLMLVLTLLK
ncbi:MAG: cupin domain-containing protein [Planctomycetales bacterium]|nr:cupin domain-containing protein [Planctomycetales bacterium]